MRSNETVPKKNPSRNTLCPFSRTRGFRVSWRRDGWSASSNIKSRRFDSEYHARDFAQRLRDLDEFYGKAHVTVERREIHAGPWEEI